MFTFTLFLLKFESTKYIQSSNTNIRIHSQVTRCVCRVGKKAIKISYYLLSDNIIRFLIHWGCYLYKRFIVQFHLSMFGSCCFSVDLPINSLPSPRSLSLSLWTRFSFLKINSDFWIDNCDISYICIWHMNDYFVVFKMI